MLSLDVDVTSLDINQCDPSYDANGQLVDPPESQLSYFLGTHKCDNESAKVSILWDFCAPCVKVQGIIYAW